MDDYARVWHNKLGRYFNIMAPNSLQLSAIINYFTNADIGLFDNVVASMFPKPGVIVDIGAALGQTVFFMSHYYPDKQFICIEPYKESIRYLEYNTRDLNATIVHAAASDTYKTVSLAFPTQDQRDRKDLRFNTGLLSTYGKGEIVETIIARPLDVILGDTKVFMIDLDVEGNEYEVLLGAKKIIERDKPYLHVEVDHYNQIMGGRKVEELVKLIQDYGYRIKYYVRNNIFFVPKEE
jgi:FkbM family methyltransferase